MRYIVWLKKNVNPSNVAGWKERVKNVPGVTIIGSMDARTLLIDASFDAINLLRHQLGGIYNFEEDLQTRFDI